MKFELCESQRIYMYPTSSQNCGHLHKSEDMWCSTYKRFYFRKDNCTSLLITGAVYRAQRLILFVQQLVGPMAQFDVVSFYSTYCNSIRCPLDQSWVMPFQATLLIPCPAAAHVLSDQVGFAIDAFNPSRICSGTKRHPLQALLQ
jgi:hypothetical protein